jgi:hypothetical protein
VADKPFACPDCSRTFRTAANLGAHRRLAPDHSRPASEPKPAAKTAVTPDAVLALAVENLRNDGALLAATVAPHLGVAIHGNSDPDQGPLVVSRAVMAGNLLRGRIEKDARLLRLLLAWNRLHEVPEGLQLAASLGVALAVDTGRLAPDQTFVLKVAGREFPIQPAALAIGDVLDYVAANSAPAPPPEGEAGRNGQVSAPAVVAGGVEAT